MSDALLAASARGGMSDALLAVVIFFLGHWGMSFALSAASARGGMSDALPAVGISLGTGA
jgi:hypothetical protein